MPNSVSTALSLLEQLLVCANTGADPTHLLHESVVLYRLDGECLRGRTAVVEAVCSRGSSVQLELVARETEALRVALRIPGVPSALHFWFRALVRDGTLHELEMYAPPFPDRVQ